MPIRCQGARYARTGSTPLLDGATTASVALWVHFHVGSGAASGGNATLLGQDFQRKFAIYVQGGYADRVTLLWEGVGSTGAILPSVAGVSYHLAMTTAPGEQRFYVNGNLVGSASSLDPLITRASVLQLGPDVAGPDVTLDDAAVWDGHALSLAEVRSLRDRTAAPADIAPAQLAWSLSLDGTEGEAATAADAGLQDGGTAGVDVSEVSSPAPVYGGAIAAYEAPVRARSVQVGPSGETLVIVLEENDGDLTDVLSVDSHPVVTIDGGAPATLSTPIWGHDASRRLPYVVYPLDAPVGPSAVVAVTADEGWCVTAAGVAAGIAATAENPTTTLLPAFASVPKTMAHGFNLTNPGINQGFYYADFVKQSGGFREVAADPANGLTVDADGFPVSLSESAAETIVTVPSQDNGGVAELPGWPLVCADGLWTLTWSGPAEARLVGSSGTTTVVEADDWDGSDKANRRVYRVTRGAYYSPHLALRIMGPFDAGEFRDPHLYPPDPDDPLAASLEACPATFHPDFLRMLAGSTSVRFMGTTWTNGCNVTEAAHLTPPSALTPSEPNVLLRPDLVAVGPYANPDGFFPEGGTPLTLTTAAPHGLATGQTVALRDLAADGAYANGDPLNLQNLITMVHALSPTTLAIRHWQGAEGRTVAEQAIDGWLWADVLAGPSVADLATMCAEAEADPWICVPHALDDAGVAELADQWAAALPAGRRLRVEYTNEHWNSALYYTQNEWCYAMGAAEGLSRTQWYAKRSGEVHAIFAAALAGAGRAADLIRVFGSHRATLGTTTTILDYCVANGIPVDELAVAPYMNNGPAGSVLDAAYDRLSIDGLMDLSELYVQHIDSLNEGVATHRALLLADFPDARLVTYEGGAEEGCPAGTGDTAARSRAWGRHPRMRGIYLRYLQQQQDQGCPLLHSLGLVGSAARYQWATYIAHGQPAGAGDGSDGQFDNRTDYEDLDNVVSVLGRAIDDWEALYAGDVPDQPSPRRRFRGRRHV